MFEQLDHVDSKALLGAKIVVDRDRRSGMQIAIAIVLIALGCVTGPFALALVSNQFGNTGTVGLLLLGLASWFAVTGLCYLLFSKNFLIATSIGVLAAPVSIGLLVVSFWVLLSLTAYGNRHHQEFAANGVSQIAPARQMDELFNDCRHYITYGTNNVTMFNSVAYFGDRYELTMQVPVRIESKTSGSVIGEPRFYLDEISDVRWSPSGGVGVSYSRNMNFGATEWEQVYSADGDFSTIGFNVNPAPVVDFQKYTDAARPSN